MLTIEKVKEIDSPVWWSVSFQRILLRVRVRGSVGDQVSNDEFFKANEIQVEKSHCQVSGRNPGLVKLGPQVRCEKHLSQTGAS